MWYIPTIHPYAYHPRTVHEKRFHRMCWRVYQKLSIRCWGRRQAVEGSTFRWIIISTAISILPFFTLVIPISNPATNYSGTLLAITSLLYYQVAVYYKREQGAVAEKKLLCTRSATKQINGILHTKATSQKLTRDKYILKTKFCARKERR